MTFSVKAEKILFLKTLQDQKIRKDLQILGSNLLAPRDITVLNVGPVPDMDLDITVPDILVQGMVQDITVPDMVLDIITVQDTGHKAQEEGETVSETPGLLYTLWTYSRYSLIAL